MKKHNEQIQDDDPADGMKAIGCLFIGIFLILAFLGIASYIINHLRPPL